MAAQNAPKTQRGTVKDLGDWGLADMIAVAAELNILADDDGVTAVGSRRIIAISFILVGPLGAAKNATVRRRILGSAA